VSSEDEGEDAEEALPMEPNRAPEAGAPPPSDDEGYVWPEGSEAAPVVALETKPEVMHAPLPSLDELINRLPQAVRETYDELFRGKFTGVKRVSPEVLKR